MKPSEALEAYRAELRELATRHDSSARAIIVWRPVQEDSPPLKR